jgi:hypothetical protein
MICGVEAPWREVGTFPIGGLTEVGFVGSEWVLVVSHQGRGVFDIRSGTRVARDPDETPWWFDADTPAALGIGPLQGRWVPVAGLAGGRLASTTAEGWEASQTALGVRLERGGNAQQEVIETEEIRTFGFTDDGRTFVLGSSPTLRLFCLD